MWFRWRSKAYEESAEALESAQRNVRDIQKRSVEVTAIADALKTLRERNHFAEQIEELIIRRRGSVR